MSDSTKLHIVKLLAYQSAGLNGDKLLLIHSEKKIWPANIFFTRSQPELKIDLRLTDLPHGEVKIELWKYNYIRPNKYLGLFRITVDATTPVDNVFVCELLEKGSTYSRYAMMWSRCKCTSS